MSYIGNEPIVSATRTITEVTATAGQTVFTANGGYTVGYIDVFLNGAQLQTVDFTATNGTTITLTEAAQVGDVIRLVAWGTFSTATHVLKAGDTMTGQLRVQRAGGSAGSGNLVYVDVTSSFGGISVNSTANNNSFVELLEAGTKVGGFNADTTNNVTSVQSAGGHALAFNVDNTTEVGRFDTSGNLRFNSGYGSVATAYGCRAWVNFNGTGTVAIRASGNVSSITDNGTGDYTVNFTTAMPDANYSATLGGNGSGSNDGAGRILQSFYSTGTYLSTSVRLSCLWAGDGSTREDKNIVTVAVFR